jgi:hypothetical protein
MKAFTATSRFSIARLILATILACLIGSAAACSSSNPVGQSDIRKEKTSASETSDAGNTIKPDGSGNGTRSTTTQIQGGGISNDYTGTIDPELIAAAYLACGRTDDEGNYIGCNAYETQSDRRLPLENRPDVKWVATADNVQLTRVDPGPLSPKVKLAFAAKVRGMGAKNPKVTVQLNIQPDKRRVFQSYLSTMAMVSDMVAFGNVSSMSLGNIGSPTLSGFLNSVTQGQLRASRQSCTWFDRLGTRIGRPCNGGTFFPYYPELTPYTVNQARIGGPDINSPYLYCDNFANLLQAITCGN